MTAGGANAVNERKDRRQIPRSFSFDDGYLQAGVPAVQEALQRLTVRVVQQVADHQLHGLHACVRCRHDG